MDLFSDTKWLIPVIIAVLTLVVGIIALFMKSTSKNKNVKISNKGSGSVSTGDINVADKIDNSTKTNNYGK